MPKIKSATIGASATAAVILAGAVAANAAEGFRLTSPSFADHDMLPSKFAAKGGPRNCDGENISPALTWSDAPEGTKSFAIILHDTAGNHGLGVTHWVAYGIPGGDTGFDEGEVSAPPANGNYVGGTNRIGKPFWFGPCPDVGHVPQHYLFTLIATDLDPSALEPGLDKDALLKNLEGHALGGTTLVGRYAR